VSHTSGLGKAACCQRYAPGRGNGDGEVLTVVYDDTGVEEAVQKQQQ